MKLPSSNDQWTDKHLTRVEAAFNRQFDLYEQHDGVNQRKADDHYLAALRLAEQAENLRVVLHAPKVIYI